LFLKKEEWLFHLIFNHRSVKLYSFIWLFYSIKHLNISPRVSNSFHWSVYFLHIHSVCKNLYIRKCAEDQWWWGGLQLPDGFRNILLWNLDISLLWLLKFHIHFPFHSERSFLLSWHINLCVFSHKLANVLVEQRLSDDYYTHIRSVTCVHSFLWSQISWLNTSFPTSITNVGLVASMYFYIDSQLSWFNKIMRSHRYYTHTLTLPTQRKLLHM
jgi:hypothetical protein